MLTLNNGHTEIGGALLYQESVQKDLADQERDISELIEFMMQDQCLETLVMIASLGQVRPIIRHICQHQHVEKLQTLMQDDAFREQAENAVNGPSLAILMDAEIKESLGQSLMHVLNEDLYRLYDDLLRNDRFDLVTDLFKQYRTGTQEKDGLIINRLMHYAVKNKRYDSLNDLMEQFGVPGRDACQVVLKRLITHAKYAHAQLFWDFPGVKEQLGGIKCIEYDTFWQVFRDSPQLSEQLIDISNIQPKSEAEGSMVLNLLTTRRSQGIVSVVKMALENEFVINLFLRDPYHYIRYALSTEQNEVIISLMDILSQDQYSERWSFSYNDREILDYGLQKKSQEIVQSFLSLPCMKHVQIKTNDFILATQAGFDDSIIKQFTDRCHVSMLHDLYKKDKPVLVGLLKHLSADRLNKLFACFKGVELKDMRAALANTTGMPIRVLDSLPMCLTNDGLKINQDKPQIKEDIYEDIRNELTKLKSLPLGERLRSYVDGFLEQSDIDGIISYSSSIDIIPILSELRQSDISREDGAKVRKTIALVESKVVDLLGDKDQNPRLTKSNYLNQSHLD